MDIWSTEQIKIQLLCYIVSIHVHEQRNKSQFLIVLIRICNVNFRQYYFFASWSITQVRVNTHFYTRTATKSHERCHTLVVVPKSIFCHLETVMAYEIQKQDDNSPELSLNSYRASLKAKPTILTLAVWPLDNNKLKSKHCPTFSYSNNAGKPDKLDNNVGFLLSVPHTEKQTEVGRAREREWEK